MSMMRSTVENGDSNPALTKAVRLFTQLTKKQKSAKPIHAEAKRKAIADINHNLELALSKNSNCTEIFCEAKVIQYVKSSFGEPINRASLLNFLRLLLANQRAPNLFLASNIPLYVCKVIERDEAKNKPSTDYEEQTIEALRLAADWLNKYPENFPRLIACTIVSFCQLPVVSGFEERKKDHVSQQLKVAAIDVVLAMTAKHPKLCARVGGFLLLSNSIVDISCQQRSYDILCRLLYFLNERRNRELAVQYIDLRKIFSVFTDLDNVFLEDNAKNKGNIEITSRFQQQLSLARTALVTILKSWTGLIFLGNEPALLESFLEALRQIPKHQDSQVRRSIYATLSDVISVGDGLLHDSVAVPSNEFKASSLVNCYMTSLIELLMKQGLYKLFVELSGVDQLAVAEPAQRLLKKLSIYLFNFVPDASKYVDFLISAATHKGKDSQILKYSSSFVINKIGNYIYDSKTPQSNPFMGELALLFGLDGSQRSMQRSSVFTVAKSLNFIDYRSVPYYRRKLLELRPIPKQFKENFKQWKWQMIIDLLAFPETDREGHKPDASEKHKQGKFFNYLLRFFSYFRGNFMEQKWVKDNFIYLRAGKLFLKNVLVIPDNFKLVLTPPESQFAITISFIDEIYKLLGDVLVDSFKSRQKYYPAYFKTFERELLHWIGCFTETKNGFQSLCEHNFFELLMMYVAKPECGLIIGGVMLYMDYYRENKEKNYLDQVIVVGPKKLLEKAVAQGSKRLKLFSIQIIRFQLKLRLQTFIQDWLKLLLTLITDNQKEVNDVALSATEEVIKQSDILASLLSILLTMESNNSAQFELIKRRFTSNLCILLSSEAVGFDLLERCLPTWMEDEFQKWLINKQSETYFLNLENLLSSSLNLANERLKGYSLGNIQDSYELIYLYRLPWLLHVNDEQIPLWPHLKQNRLILSCELTDQEYRFRENHLSEQLLFSLAIGNMFVNSQLEHCSARQNIRISLKNYVQIDQEKELCCSQMDGCEVFFQITENETCTISKISVQIALLNLQDNERLPLHFIQYITKTEKGRAFLASKNILQHAKSVLENKESIAQDMRAVLWSIGYYGSTQEGMGDLLREGIADLVVQMSSQCSTLSLRGTCRYILNMFCHSELGRNYLATKRYSVNKKYLNCFPTDSASFYWIEDSRSQHFCFQQQLWKQYKQSMQPLHENEEKIFSAISLLINSLSAKTAVLQIKDLIKANPKSVFSYSLLQNVLNLMSFFKMRFQSRKTIHSIFEDFVKSPKFIADSDNKIRYAYDPL